MYALLDYVTAKHDTFFNFTLKEIIRVLIMCCCFANQELKDMLK